MIMLLCESRHDYVFCLFLHIYKLRKMTLLQISMTEEDLWKKKIVKISFENSQREFDFVSSEKTVLYGGNQMIWYDNFYSVS